MYSKLPIALLDSGLFFDGFTFLRDNELNCNKSPLNKDCLGITINCLEEVEMI